MATEPTRYPHHPRAFMALTGQLMHLSLYGQAGEDAGRILDKLAEQGLALVPIGEVPDWMREAEDFEWDQDQTYVVKADAKTFYLAHYPQPNRPLDTI
jgi:predicted SpoU family rRNA methylase